MPADRPWYGELVEKENWRRPGRWAGNKCRPDGVLHVSKREARPVHRDQGPDGPCEASVLACSSDARGKTASLLVLLDLDRRRRRRAAVERTNTVPDIQIPRKALGRGLAGRDAKRRVTMCTPHLRGTVCDADNEQSRSLIYGTARAMDISIRPSRGHVIRLMRSIPARPSLLFGRMELGRG